MKVSVELAATLPLPDSGGYGNVKPRISIDEIDPDGDVEAQIALGIEIAQKAFVRIDEQLDVSISEIISTDSKPGYREQVDNLSGEVKKLKDVVKKMADRLIEAGIGKSVSAKKEGGN